MFISRLRSATGLFQRLIAGVSLMLISGIATAEYGLNFQRPVTPIAKDIFELHMLITIIMLVIITIVGLIILWSILFHRKSSGRKPATFHHSSKLEVVWTIIPFAILIGIAIPSTKVLLKMDDTSNADMTVKITGYQWKWEYEYPEQGVKFMSSLSSTPEQIGSPTFSRQGFKAGSKKGENYLLEVDRPMVLPVGKKIRFLITANDVNHAWWVPQFGTKKDAIPGFINEFWTKIEEPGTYRGQCAELCGKDHGYMPIVVKAVSGTEFKKWANLQKSKMTAVAASASRKWSKVDLMKRGQAVYSQSCIACHGATGAGIPNVFPAITGSKISNGKAKDHIDIVMNGRPGTSMAAFRKQLSDVDIAAVVTYERNALGNNKGDVVQPSQAKALRGGLTSLY